MPSVFISHNHEDKHFVERLGADLVKAGASPWIDDAEINVGDSLIEKIQVAIDTMDYFAIVLTPRSVSSAWVQQELEQAVTRQLASQRVSVLPLLLEKCEIPGCLRGKLHADFSDYTQYERSVLRLLKAMGLVQSIGPSRCRWFCIECGWGCNDPNNDDVCGWCHQNRYTYEPEDGTMRICPTCLEPNYAYAHFCEHCGRRM